MKKIFLILFVCFFAVNLSAQEDSIKTNKFYFSFYNATSLDYYYRYGGSSEKFTDIEKKYAYRYLFIPFDSFFMLGYKRAELGFGISRFRFNHENLAYPNFRISTTNEYSATYFDLIWLLKTNYMFLNKDKYNLKLTAGYGHFMSIGLLAEYDLNKQTSLYTSISYQKNKYRYNIYHQKYKWFDDRVSFRLGIKFSNKQTYKNYSNTHKYGINAGIIMGAVDFLGNSEEQEYFFHGIPYQPVGSGHLIGLSYSRPRYVPYIGIIKNNKKVIQSINFGYGSYSDNYFPSMGYLYNFKYAYYALFYDIKIPVMLKHKNNKMIYAGTKIYLDYANLTENFNHTPGNINYSLSASLPLSIGYRTSFKHFSFDTGINLYFFKYIYYFHDDNGLNTYYHDHFTLSRILYNSLLNLNVSVGFNL